MLRRFASTQIRNAATIGGNIANGSPIGDGPPALIALGTTLTLRKGGTRREILLQDFFIDYGKQDIAAGEFVESIFIPAQEDRLKCYKLTKRFDQDISAVLGCFNIHIKDGLVACCAIAYGGMAATPKRASHVEKALLGKPWTKETITVALPAFAIDFTPMSDIRASREYRLKAAQNHAATLLSGRLGRSAARIGCCIMSVTSPTPHDAALLHVTGQSPLCRRCPDAGKHTALGVWLVRYCPRRDHID